MTIDHCKPNQGVTPIVIAVQGVISSLIKSVWSVALDFQLQPGKSPFLQLARNS